MMKIRNGNATQQVGKRSLVGPSRRILRVSTSVAAPEAAGSTKPVVPAGAPSSARLDIENWRSIVFLLIAFASGLNKFSARITQPKSQGASQAMLYATGLKEEDMNKPQIGISSVWWVSSSSQSPTCWQHTIEGVLHGQV